MGAPQVSAARRHSLKGLGSGALLTVGSTLVDSTAVDHTGVPMAPQQQQLTELQTTVLRLLWEQGELTVGQLWEQLYDERKLAQTTVATIVARLQRRGILARRTRDRQFVYRALITEADVQHSMVSELT